MAGRISYLGGIVTQGLVLDLDAGKRDSYVGIGTAWNDISGNRNNGTLINGPTFNSGNGGSIVFDGSNDYVDCGNNITSATTITVNAWIRLNVNNIFQHIIDSSNNTWHLAVLDNGRVYFWDGNVYHIAGGILNTSIWYMVTGVKTSTTNDVYINGLISNSLSSNNLLTTNTINLARWQINGFNPTPSRYLNGNISSTQIYNRSLSSTEVLQNYNATKNRYL